MKGKKGGFMKNKKIAITIIVIIAVILLFPIPMKLKDGGSIKFQAALYSITKYHQLNHETEAGYIDGLGVEILGIEIINTIDGELLFEKYGNDEENIKGDYNSFVGTVLEETTAYMIVEPNEDEEERKSSDKIQINYGTDHRDYLYGIGRKVIINYTGYIKETYPAQIDSNNISVNGYEDFEITVVEAENQVTKKVLNNQELYKNNSNFDLYYYNLSDVNVKVDGKTITLEDALRSGKITLDGIVSKANADFPDNIYHYDDGGSEEYHYENYTIIKLHKLTGNRDVYIAKKGTSLINLNIE